MERWWLTTGKQSITGGDGNTIRLIDLLPKPDRERMKQL